ncbi:glyceraldehyde 3-phosphate dehydrogenase NAD-binding domain-containing protein [Mesorhizobium sp.]|uniref:glyceraldehyde 3-phosphate dehydrogenase NAD-binding domain-containing protein n=1 Tax=Mesorhizobium sp. TaxID=1871066 RepID=UPI0034294FEE
MASQIRIGINGFGRIGRMVFRAAMARDDIEIVAVNDLLPIDHLAYLLKYDSVHGRFAGEIAAEAKALRIDGRVVAAFEEREPGSIRWGDAGVDLVIDSTGRFLTEEQAGGHIRAGAAKVLLSAPPDDDPSRPAASIAALRPPMKRSIAFAMPSRAEATAPPRVSPHDFHAASEAWR